VLPENSNDSSHDVKGLVPSSTKYAGSKATGVNILLSLIINGRSAIRGFDGTYPGPVVQALLMYYDLPGEEAPAVEWQDIYGIITGDCQSHAVVRGFAHSLLHPPEGSKALPTASVQRYRINWRAKSLDAWLDPKVGLCHGSDVPIWWCSKVTQEWLEPFADFVAGREIKWGTKGEDEVRRLDESGEIKVVKDEDWKRGLEVWDLMHQAQR
jgi:hypothetical protein